MTYDIDRTDNTESHGERKQIKVLNRILTWESKGVKYEADPRHAEILIKELGMEDARGVKTPGTKEEGRTKDTIVTSL